MNPTDPALDIIERTSDPVVRIRLSTQYLAHVAELQRQAVLVRDRAIADVTGVGPAQLAKATGTSVSVIKNARRPR